MTITWTEKATSQLDQIFSYIKVDSPFYAYKTIDRIIEQVEVLSEYPYSGRVVPEYKREDIREVFYHPYRIIYLIKEDGIEVLSIIHDARQLPENPL